MIDTTVLRQLCEQATPGPWERLSHLAGTCHKVKGPPCTSLPRCEGGGVHYKRIEDAEFVAAAREALPQLLDENAALRSERDEMKGALAAYGIGKEGEDWYYTCEPDGQVDAADLTDAIGKMSALKDEDQLTLESRLAALKEAGEKVVETPGLTFHMSHCQTNEFGVGVSRPEPECTCELGKRVAAFTALLRSDP